MTPEQTKDLIAKLRLAVIENMNDARSLRAEGYMALEAAAKIYPTSNNRSEWEAYWKVLRPFWQNDHARRGPLRWEARFTLLAYGLLRNRSYKRIEPKTVMPIDKYMAKKVQNILDQFGCTDEVIHSKVLEWLERGDVRLRDMLVTEAAA